MTDKFEPARDIARLIDIMKALRTPGTGCPWDLEQTFATIAPYTIEEAYEVADAIQRGDLADLRDELGDLLLQVVYHARLAEEQAAFDFGDVVMGVTAKMIRRHSHVFGDATAKSAGAVKGLWDQIKAQERAAKPQASAGVLADVPVALPALTRAIKLQHKAATVGFDWPSLAPVFDKMREELAELEHELRRSAPSGRLSEGQSEGANARESDAAVKAAMKEEFGDLLFVMANVARHLKIDPEDALRAANEKFSRRFAHIEARLAEQGRHPAQSTLDDMDALWDEAKALERASSA
ncbi:MAG: nucleoside triphosphate pyrophosphohydrolase [Hyphomicrobium sp.]|nr:nucleoside triphosphate pyrophosphohydrolase [Hyphomicrobium sp.]